MELTKTKEVNSFDYGWTGIPTLMDLGGTRIGAFVPDVVDQ